MVVERRSFREPREHAPDSVPAAADLSRAGPVIRPFRRPGGHGAGGRRPRSVIDPGGIGRPIGHDLLKGYE
jgi:hypothetical protein